MWSISKISDAITLLAPGNVRYRIRLACIDAPSRSGVREPIQAEPLQPRLWETVNLDRGKKESYGWLVLVCKILLPDGEDVRLDQVKAGMTWHYKQFENQQTSADRQAYAPAGDAARASKVGLWSERSCPDTRMGFPPRCSNKAVLR